MQQQNEYSFLDLYFIVIFTTPLQVRLHVNSYCTAHKQYLEVCVFKKEVTMLKSTAKRPSVEKEVT